MPTDSQVDAMRESPIEPHAFATVTSPVVEPTSPVVEPNPPVVEPVETPHRPPKDWRRSYQRRLWITDLVALIWVVYGTQIVWFGMGDAQLSIREDPRITDVSYWVFSGGLIVLWMGALSWSDSRSHRIIGAGTTEYVRVVDASLRVFGAIAIVAFLLQIDVARGFLLISLPLGILMLLVVRWLWRQWLVAKRIGGEFSARVLLVGSADSAAQIARELERSPSSGYEVVGACTSSRATSGTLSHTSIPVIGCIDDVEQAMLRANADTVVVTSTDDLPPDKVKQISWGLQAGRQHLVLAPSILDIAGPRIHTRPVAGLPLIHVETPRFSKGQLFVKRTFDIIGALLFIVLLSPVLLAVTAAVSWTSIGPLLYKQERIGRNGEPFKMLKFRSMRVGADKELKALLEAQGTSEKPLFKIKDDPRITPVGKFIRKYSLDELPQLFNVLGGSMSLVGPRPQIAAEVALYTDAARRRLLARPGLTGLWQVSGRSSLDWEDAVRLDLYYVENWSLVGDLAILAKTARAVIAPGESAH